ncbi:MAG: SUMF1/EgtB/PvdO family nonheme iron enzyme [Proteobacteria bacterium]|nr:SUMF1/EgtB/PvdO family nonheme iron enzyme [Pseudomonadota bacterium]
MKKIFLAAALVFWCFGAMACEEGECIPGVTYAPNIQLSERRPLEGNNPEGKASSQEAHHDIGSGGSSAPVLDTSDGMVLVGEIGKETQAWVPCELAASDCDGQSLKRISLKSFYIDTYEVTFGAVKACIDSGKCTHDRFRFYVTNDPGKLLMPARFERDFAEVYCKSMGKRLPKPEEWLLAAMGTEVQNYPWGNEKADGMFAEEISTVGQFPRDLSVWGAYDMGGNATEWVQGAPSGKYVPGLKCGDPRTWPSMGDARNVRIFEQFGRGQSDPHDDITAGVRCVKDL